MTAPLVRRLGRMMLRRQAASPLCVVVAAGRGLVVEIGESEGRLQPRRAVPFSFDKTDLGTLRGALRQVLDEGGWRDRQIAFGLEGDWVRQGVVTLPSLSQGKLEPMLAHEAAGLAGVTGEAAPLTGFAWGHQRYRATEVGQQVLLAVCDRALIHAVTAASAASGCVPVHATTLGIAGLHRLTQHEAMAGIGMVAQVAVDSEETTFTVFENERLVFSRVLLRGFHASHGGEDADLDPESRVALERLAQELQRTVLYVKREMRQAIDLMVIGGVPRSAGAARQLLGESLRLPVAWESLPPDGIQAEPGAESLYLAALGVALACRDGRGINLLPRPTFDERHPAVGGVAVAASVLLWIGAVGWAGARVAALHEQSVSLSTEVAARMARLRPAVQAVDDRYQRLQADREEITRYLQVLEAGSGRVSTAAALARLGGGLPSNAVLLDCSLKRSAEGWRCTLRGAVVADGRDAAARSYEALLRHFEDSPYFVVETPGRERVPPSDGRIGHVALVQDAGNGSVYPFVLDCRLVVPEGRP